MQNSCNLPCICWSQLSWQRFEYDFITKGLKLVHGIIQLDIRVSNESWASWSIILFSWIHIWQRINAYRYQQECNKFHITKEVWALQLSLGNILRILPYHEFTLIRWDNELQSKRYWNSGSSNRQMVIEDNRTAAQKKLPNILYHHP
jgi:hypothetical protein